MKSRIERQNGSRNLLEHRAPQRDRLFYTHGSRAYDGSTENPFCMHIKNQIWHNPRCSKSRQTLVLLREKDIELEVVEYLKVPPTATDILAACQLLDRTPLQLCRTQEARFKALGLRRDDNRSDQDWAELMSANPILIERPVVFYQQRAALGRPPEAVLELL